MTIFGEKTTVNWNYNRLNENVLGKFQKDSLCLAIAYAYRSPVCVCSGVSEFRLCASIIKTNIEMCCSATVSVVSLTPSQFLHS